MNTSHAPTRPRAAIAAAVFLALAPALRGEQVIISEIMYHPAGDLPEYVEVHNLSATPIDIAEWRLRGAVDYDFPAFFSADRSFLGPYETILIASVSETALRAAYPGIPAGTEIYGPWSGSLDNAGERVTLRDKNGTTASSVRYDDRGNWSPAADGAGHSLVMSNPDRFVDDWHNWSASQGRNGSPGTFPDASPGLSRRVVLSEVHLDGDGKVDWVELYNPGSQSLSLANYGLATSGEPADRLPLDGTIPAGQYRSWDVSLTPSGGEIPLFLFAPDGDVVDAAAPELSAHGDAFQTYPAGSTEWYVSATSSRDSANDPARNNDIVISEVMFETPANQRAGEFIEIHNRGSAEVDLTGWAFVQGVDFEFPPGTTLAAGGYLAVAADGAWMREAYGDIAVVGDFSGTLRNQGELIRLEDASGNLADAVDYRTGGDWPHLTSGLGSSMELAHPDLDNDFPSAWRDSDESEKGAMKEYSYNETYRTNLPNTSGDRELHFHLVGDGYLILENINLGGRPSILNPNPINHIRNGDRESPNGNSSQGWVAQGTHWQSHLDAEGRLHIISDGRGDNRPNRVEIDLQNLDNNDNVTLSFDARWVYGKPRLIGQTHNHSVANAFLIEVPDNLGTPGAPNSAAENDPPPQVDFLTHSPAVPRANQNVTITARVASADPLSRVEVVHRRDNNNRNANWQTDTMFDNGFGGGDEVAGDGIYTATLNDYRSDGSIAEFFVRARSNRGAERTQPRFREARPALFITDNTTPPNNNLRTVRVVLSQYDRRAFTSGFGPDHDYKFPGLSNSYKNATVIMNDRDIYYSAEVRPRGSPWHRTGGTEVANNGKYKLPLDRLFRNHRKINWDDDPTGGNRHFNDRMIRYWFYLFGHPANENEFINVIINGGNPQVREEVEPVANDFISRSFENGTMGELYRIDDEWWFNDSWGRQSRNADWRYKGSDNPGRYHTEWAKRTRETEYDFSAIVDYFQAVSGSYTEESISRYVDLPLLGLHAAVRGYTYDWDNITLNRGKNSYFYRRPTDGKFMLLHWDSDLAFRSGDVNNGFVGNLPEVGELIRRPYVVRYMNAYLALMADDFTAGSRRIDVWFDQEEAASSGYSVPRNSFNSFFSGRNNKIDRDLGNGIRRPFRITTSAASTAADTYTLNGTASYQIFEVFAEGHPEADFEWVGENDWELSGIQLRQGQNTIVVNGLDFNGNRVGSILNPQSDSITVTKTGNAAPAVDLDLRPDSPNVSVTERLELDPTDSYDPEGNGLTFEWEAPEGLAAFSTNSDGSAVAQFDRPGLYTFTLTVSDPAGNQVTVSHQASVHGPSGFSSFGTSRLDPVWSRDNVKVRANTPVGAYYSLEDDPGKLILMAEGDGVYPMRSTGATHPFLHRPLPPAGEWSLHTKVKLDTIQSGQFQVGLQVEIMEGASPVRYALALQDGDRLSAFRVSGTTVQRIGTMTLNQEGETVRIRRESDTVLNDRLVFEYRTGGTWTQLHATAVPVDATALRGGLFVATEREERVRASFDYAMLVDPSALSPLEGSLRIAELMYHPVGGSEFEFVELINIGTEPIDLEGVRFSEGIDFTFGAETLAPGARLVVVKNQASFAARYDTAGIHVAAGEYVGRLNNGGELIQVLDSNGQLVLSFAYETAAPWPAEPDGTGPSLELLEPEQHLADPSIWQTSATDGGTPGRPPLTIGEGDSDGDGLPDTWEEEHGFNPGSADALGDADGDGFSNLAEYHSGTDPRSSGSFFQAVAGHGDGGGVSITFRAAAGRRFVVEVRDSLAEGDWSVMQTIEPDPADRDIEVEDDLGDATVRFYRLRATAAP